MAFVITEPCVGTCDTACVPVCPVDAIYDEDELPEEYEKFIEINAKFFEEN